MENFNFGRAINIFLIAFVIFIVIMIAFVARLVSTFMVKNKNTNLTKTYAGTVAPAETPLEVAHTTTMSLSRLSEQYAGHDAEQRMQDHEVLMAIAQARKQALDSLFESDPNTVLATLFPEDARQILPAEVQSFIEASTITEGKLKVTQIPEKPLKQYSVIARNGEEFYLYFTDTKELQIQPNSQVRVRGVQLGNKIVVQTIKEI